MLDVDTVSKLTRDKQRLYIIMHLPLFIDNKNLKLKGGRVNMNL